MTEAQFAAMLAFQGEQVELLREIRDLLRIHLEMAIEDDAAEVTTGCQHPEEMRVDMSTMGDLNHWICRLCRYDNKAPEHVMN